VLRVAATLLAVLAVLVVTGCSGSDGPDATPPTVTVTAQPSESASAASMVAADPPLELIGGGTSRTCFGPLTARDLAYWNETWKANTDINSIKFRLVNPIGVHQLVGDTINVPPVNFGGRIDYSGFAAWDDRAEVLDDKVLVWDAADQMAFETPIEDESGLAVLHLRFDEHALASPAGATFDGVTARYRTADGETGTVSIDDQSIFRAKDRC
jgi:hypothetical protein